MPALDIRSLTLASVLAAMVLAAVLAFMRHYYPRHVRGIGHWAAAALLWCLAAALYSSARLTHPVISSTIASTFLLAGFGVYYTGCRRFSGRPARWRATAAAAALAIATIAWFTHVQPSWPAQLRSMIGSVAGAEFAILVFLQRHGRHSLPTRMIQGACAGQMLVIAYRLWTTFDGRAGLDLMDKTFEETIMVASFAPTLTLMCFGALLMATDQVVEELQHQITHDPLTGTLNRRALMQRCANELKRCERAGEDLSLLMVDLDHFKRVNDRHGHQHGDAVLVHFAQRVRELLRGSDLLGRYGGEEFMVALPAAGAAQGHAAAQRIHQALARGHALDCPCSIGLATWDGPGDTLQALIQRADQALYCAKSRGRNQTCAH